MRAFCISVLLLLTAAVSFAQAPRVTLFVPNSEVYVGYITTFPDYGAHYSSYRFNGAQLDYTKNYRPHLALVGSGAMVFGSSYDVKQFSGTVGPKVNLLTGRFRPYVTLQAGYAHQSSNGMYAGDHHPPLAHRANDTESGFTYRYGGGLDIQVTHKLYWRALQYDLQPQPWGRHTPDYSNWGSGVGYRF